MDTSGVHLWLIVWKAYQSLREHAEAHIASLGLGLSDFGVLEVLFHRGPKPVNEIGEKVNLTSGSITAAVDRLEKKGLVERRNDPGDRRARVVHLTEAGDSLIRCAFADHSAAMERATSALTPEEREQAINLMRKLGRGAQAISPRLARSPRERPVHLSDHESE
jgi:MarR family 2-MHQ and catechol resistance regulon transcriptional repressor